MQPSQFLTPFTSPAEGGAQRLPLLAAAAAGTLSSSSGLPGQRRRTPDRRAARRLLPAAAAQPVVRTQWPPMAQAASMPHWFSHHTCTIHRPCQSDSQQSSMATTPNARYQRVP